VLKSFSGLGYLFRQYLRREPIDVWLDSAIKEMDPQINSSTAKYNQQVISLLNPSDTKFSGMFNGLGARYGNRMGAFLAKAPQSELSFQAAGSGGLTSRQLSSSTMLLELAFSDLSQLFPE